MSQLCEIVGRSLGPHITMISFVTIFLVQWGLLISVLTHFQIFLGPKARQRVPWSSRNSMAPSLGFVFGMHVV